MAMEKPRQMSRNQPDRQMDRYELDKSNRFNRNNMYSLSIDRFQHRQPIAACLAAPIVFGLTMQNKYPANYVADQTSPGKS